MERSLYPSVPKLRKSTSCRPQGLGPDSSLVARGSARWLARRDGPQRPWWQCSRASGAHSSPVSCVWRWVCLCGAAAVVRLTLTDGQTDAPHAAVLSFKVISGSQLMLCRRASLWRSTMERCSLCAWHQSEQLQSAWCLCGPLLHEPVGFLAALPGSLKAQHWPMPQLSYVTSLWLF